MGVEKILGVGHVAPPLRPLISRTTILILAATLVSLGVGARLPFDLGWHCLVWGGYGFLAYVVLELAASLHLRRKHSQELEEFGHKLDQWVSTDLTIQYGRGSLGGEVTAPASQKTPADSSPYALLIEDDPIVTNVVRTILEPLGLSICACEKLPKSLDLALRADLIMCDVHLASESGIPIVRELRRQKFTGPILMTGLDISRSTIIECIEAGIDDYLIKPFDGPALLQCVQRLLRRSWDESTMTDSKAELLRRMDRDQQLSTAGSGLG